MFAENFLSGGFVGIGWREISEDLGSVTTREQLVAVVRRHYPDLQSAILLSNYVSEIHRFLFEISPGDHVIIPSPEADVLHCGRVEDGPVYYDPSGEDGCPLRHRRPVTWTGEPIHLERLSPSFRDSIRSLLAVPAHTRLPSLLTVFPVEHQEELIQALRSPPAAAERAGSSSRGTPQRLLLEQVLGLSAQEFEGLVAHLLEALGFEDGELREHRGPRRGVVDACGALPLPLPARIPVLARFHRGQPGARIGADAVRELRQLLPFGTHGIFLSTADFDPAAAAAAREAGFARISLVNGDQLADLLVRHGSRLPEVIQGRLSLGQAPVRP
jgi:restriction system protein